jgi:hypothetical protein
MTWLLILILPVSFYYLGSRAMITHWLWSRYPKPLAKFMDCAACSGFWYGFGCAVIFGHWYEVSIFDLEPEKALTWILTGLVTLTTTPIGAAIHTRAFAAIGEIEEIEESDEENSASDK